MAHVEYGCPNCEKVMYRSRTAVSSLDFKPLQTITCKNCLSAVLWYEMLPTKRGKLWLGGDSGAGESFSVRLAGSANTTGAPVTTFTIPSVQARPGESLILFFATKAAALVTPPLVGSAVKWGTSEADSAGNSVLFGANLGLAMTYYFQGLTAGTNNITVDFINANKPTDVAGVVVAATGLLEPIAWDGGGALDVPTGTTAPINGAMSPSTPAVLPALLTLCHALHGDFGADNPGSWGAPITRIGSDGNGNVICDVAWRIIESPILAPVVKTGFTDRVWGLGGSYASHS
jgi:hypothetical protein